MPDGHGVVSRAGGGRTGKTLQERGPIRVVCGNGEAGDRALARITRGIEGAVADGGAVDEDLITAGSIARG